MATGKEFDLFTLHNGIRCIHRRTPSPVAHCALTIGSGTRDEAPAQHGVAHLLEHMLFKGTRRRRAYHINNTLENRGGELNAYTAKEETVVHATVLKADYRRAVDMIADVVFNSVFPEGEIEKEKGVIIEEINSYKDSPYDLIFDDFEDLLFSGSPLGRNILGSKRTIARLGRGDIFGFIDRTYNTPQMVFSSTGNIAPRRVQALCEELLGEVPSRDSESARAALPPYEKFEKTVGKGTFQSHCLMGNRAYGQCDPRRVALSLLVNILGGPMSNSILNEQLREKRGLSYNVESGYTLYSDTGVASIYFGADKDKIEQCMEIVAKELARLASSPLSSYRLNIAKRQLAGQIVVGSENNEGNMIGAGKSLLVYNAVDSISDSVAKIESVTASQIMEAAADVFNPAQMSVLAYR